ncbi:MAG: glutamate--cysteine ligase [Cyanobacteria bacterium P01_H01_bin.121]
MRLSKGFEIEMYTGTPHGEIVGLSDQIVAALNRFVREPDSRNVEYTTAPLTCYDRLLCDLLRPRLELRHFLRRLGNYTLIPGSTLSLGDSQRFYRSDPSNPYHGYIEQTYGATVVTASVHINIGIADPDELLRACRVVRAEAPLFLALSASSPFLDGQATGSHSSRWQVFPQTPKHVPFFESHQHFIRWNEAQLAAGTMQNVRHLWVSVRPNGDCRPYRLNRLELRICDLVTNPLALLAITALLEARLWQVLENPNLDPLQQSYLPATTRAEDLLQLTLANEQAAARQSLDATLHHWQYGRSLTARDWIAEIYDTLQPVARAHGFHCFLSPLQKILRQGNTAQQWLQAHQQGVSVAQVMQTAIADLEAEEQELEALLCEPLAV